jgi:putative endonuclease
VEVKTLRGNEHTYPEEAASTTKQKRIGKAATQFAAEYNTEDLPIRFDVVAVVLTSDGHLIRHYEDAFRPAFG